MIEMWLYEWLWKWQAKEFRFILPQSEIPVAEIRLINKIRDEATTKLVNKFLNEGHPLEIISINTTVTWDYQYFDPALSEKVYKAHGETITRFKTDIPHSPVNPVILGILAYVAKWVLIAVIAWFFLETAKTIFSKVEPIPEFTCPICGDVFSTAGALDAHMKDAHGITQFTCPYCGAAFSTSQELYEHMEGHEGEKIPWDLITVLVGLGIAYLFYKEWRRGE